MGRYSIPFKSKNISGFLEESSEITILPTEPTSPLKSMESPSHSTRAYKVQHIRNLNSHVYNFWHTCMSTSNSQMWCKVIKYFDEVLKGSSRNYSKTSYNNLRVIQGHLKLHNNASLTVTSRKKKKKKFQHNLIMSVNLRTLNFLREQ